MKLKTFFEKFDQFADAPDAVAKMRELIRQFAVQGRLVPQDPKDEPASDLLKRILSERTVLMSGRRGRDEDDTAKLSGDSVPYAVPKGWMWVPLGKVQVFTNGYAFKSEDYKDSGVGIIRMGELGSNGEIDESGMKYVSTEIAKSLPEMFQVKPGDLLMGMSGSIGKLAINRSKEVYLLNQRVGRLEPILIEKPYLHEFLKTVEQHYLSISFGMAIKNLSTKQINETPFPLPPLAEQKRIVVKVAELMGLCDRLEAQQQKRDEQASALARASLARFAEAPTPANLNLLFHKSYDIPYADLRKAILTMAVLGKLSAPVPSDGKVPLLKEFREAAATLADELGLRTPKESVEEAEPPFDIPRHWQWLSLAEAGIAQTGTTPSKSDPKAFDGDVPFIKPADIFPNVINYANESLTRYGAESGSRLAPAGSLLMVCIGTIGKCNLIERECAFNQQINSVSPVKFIEPRYLLIAARSPYFHETAWSKSSATTIAILNKGKWLSIPVPVPPLAEQRRIVAKVDQLMALVDQLETQLAASRDIAKNLLEALMAELTSSPRAQSDR